MTEILKLKGSGVQWVEAKDATVILDDDAEDYFFTNPAGSLIWHRLKQGATREGLVEAILEGFTGVERQQAETDVDAYIQQLRLFGLLEND